MTTVVRDAQWVDRSPTKSREMAQAYAERQERRMTTRHERRRQELGVVPDSPLAKLLAQLPRGDRRLLLATVIGAPTIRRTRNEKRLRSRLVARGIIR